MPHCGINLEEGTLMGLIVATRSVGGGKFTGVGHVTWGCNPKGYATLWHKPEQRNLDGVRRFKDTQ